MSKLKVNSIEHVAANGQALQIAPSGGVGIVTDDVTRASLVGAASSLVGLYIGDGSILFNKIGVIRHPLKIFSDVNFHIT